MVIDLHTHTAYSYDAENSPLTQHVQQAMQKGIDILGFSEHADFFYKETLKESDFAPHTVDFETYAAEVAPFRNGRVLGADLTAQQQEIHACSQKWGDRITLRRGVEMGNPQAAPELADQLLASYAFDYTIGAVHHLKSDMDLYFYRYETVDQSDFLHSYFDEMEDMFGYGRFHILAHIDYPLRVMKLPHNRPSFKGYMDRVDGILQNIIERGIALECNTKGLLGWQQTVGPERFVLDRYRELGGEYITVGSDSHAPQTIGLGVGQALDRLRDAGFRYVTDYEQGKAIQRKL